MPKFTIPSKKKVDKDENFIKFEIPHDPIQAICGQDKVKRAIEISVAGEYSLCIYGPSGQGKTQLMTAYREMYMKVYRRKVPYALYEIDGHPPKVEATLWVKIDKLPYSAINKGFNGLTSKEIVSKINVSIHAPTRGATDCRRDLMFIKRFQSTPPRGART